MSLTVNFADMEDFEPVPPGKYLAELTDVTVEQTGDDAKHPFNNYWRFEWTVQEGEQEGQKVFDNSMLPCMECAKADEAGESRPQGHDPSSNYIPYSLYHIMRASERWTEEELKDGDIEVDIDDLVGIRAVLTVRQQKKNPEYNEVRRYAPESDYEGEGSELLP